MEEVDVQPVDLGLKFGARSAWPRTCASRSPSPSSGGGPASSEAALPASRRRRSRAPATWSPRSGDAGRRGLPPGSRSGTGGSRRPRLPPSGNRLPKESCRLLTLVSHLLCWRHPDATPVRVAPVDTLVLLIRCTHSIRSAATRFPPTALRTSTRVRTRVNTGANHRPNAEPPRCLGIVSERRCHGKAHVGSRLSRCHAGPAHQLVQQPDPARTGSKSERATPTSATSDCTTSRPARGRWSFCCTASRSSGSAGGDRSSRSRPPVFASSPPTRAATTCHRSQRASRPTASTCSPPTFAASSESSVPSPRCWSVTTGAAASPGPSR